MIYARIEKNRKQCLASHVFAASQVSADAGAKIGLRYTAAIAGLLHDLGKGKNEFQDYLLEEDEARKRSMRGKINHSAAGARYVWEWAQRSGANRIDKLLSQVIALAIISHHGGMPDCISPDGKKDFVNRLYPEKDISFDESTRCFFKEVLKEKELLEWLSCAEIEIQNMYDRIATACNDLPSTSMTFFAGLMARFILSCVLDGDRYDSYRFVTDSNYNANKLVDEYKSKPPWSMLCQKLDKHIKGFSQEREINKIRAEISESCLSASKLPVGIYQLYLPTGSGKTLSSLRFAINHARAHKLDHIFYIMPYQTIIDQNAGVIRKALKYKGILEHHAGLIPQNDDEYDNRKLLTERWNVPIILTTMVQFFNSLYSDSTKSARRMHNLSKSVLVFDEVQSLPVKCVHLFNLAIAFLNRICGSTVLLCTATQPQLGQVPIPVRFNLPIDIVRDYERHFQKFRRTSVIDLRKNGSFDTKELASFILKQNTRSLLVVVNTKAAAEHLYKVLRKQINEIIEITKVKLFYLSTNLCPAHRIDVINRFTHQLEELESGKLQDSRAILISTQLIEAGVDLSVECVIRSLAGLDNIAQSAGRCNRHGEASESRPVYIIENRDENLENLPDIRQAQEACRRVLDEFADTPGSFDNDLLSPKAIKRYFDLHYHKQSEKMNYLIANLHKPATILDLLSQNTIGCTEAQKHSEEPLPLNQAFETAQKEFKVIESNTIAIVVPYMEDGSIKTRNNEKQSSSKNTTGAKDLIYNLETENDYDTLSKLLIKAQKYTVNIYKSTYSILDKKKAIRVLPCGVMVLDELYYDKEFGVTTERGMLSSLMY